MPPERSRANDANPQKRGKYKSRLVHTVVGQRDGVKKYVQT